MAHKSRVAIDPVTAKAFGTIADAYSTFETNGTAVSSGSILIIQNLTDISIMLSDDGVNDHIPVVSNGYILLDMNKYVTDKQILFTQGLVWQARRLNLGTAATVGSVFITVFHPAV